MLKPTSNVLVLEANDKKTKIKLEVSSFPKSNHKTENINSINTIKVDFSRMTKSAVMNNSSYTRCSLCKAILTVEDRHKKF